MTQALLIPPKKIKTLSGRCRLPSSCIVASPIAADLLPLEQVLADLRGMGVRGRIDRNAFGPAAVRVRRDSHLKLAGLNTTGQIRDDAYRLTVSPVGIEIIASADSGAYYGLQTLRELLAVHGKSLPCMVVEDWPDFARRGVYHDCSRGKVPTVATLKALIERLARWKINELQLYVENVFTFHRHPAIGRGYSPFTPQELLEVKDHCRLHHVRFVGSLASFGHMEKILSLPQYAHLAESPDAGNVLGLMSLCPTDPAAVRFIGELYEEFIPLFDAVDFNICCDETVDLGKGRSKARAAKVGKGQLYLDFLLKLHALCQRHGKRTNAWADIVLEHPEILPKLPRDIVMLNWDYDIQGKRIKRSHEITDVGLPMLCCPGTNGWQSHGTRLHESMVNVRDFAAEGRRRGAEGLLNTDWGDFLHRNFLGVSLHSFAHGGAHSWNGRGVDDDTFTQTFCFHALGQRDGRLAKALKLLGNTYLLVADKPLRNTDLYWALVEPLAGPRLDRKDCKASIDRLRPAGLRQVIEQLQDATIWPAPTREMDTFETLAIVEFMLAAQMDVLACQRGLAGQALRAGKTPPTAELRQLAADTADMSEAFEQLWLARNKPSRLRENLATFAGMEKEAAKLAAKA